jgi:predicted small metal-binding protein
MGLQPNEEAHMALVINCDCGFVVRGETEDELVAGGEAHMADAHPDMAGKVSREDLLAMAEEV